MIYNRLLKLFRYVTSGGSAAVVNIALLYVCTEWAHIYYLASATLSFLGAFFVSFLLQKFWTFHNTETTEMRSQMFWFFVVAGGNLVANVGLLYVTVEVLHFWYILGELLVGAFLAVVTYFVYRDLIFSSKSSGRWGSSTWMRLAPLGVLLGATLLLAAGGLFLTGALTHAIYPQTVDDDLYYLARMSAVAHGYPNIGNPYYLEHRFDSAPAFSIPDRIAAVPLSAGASLSRTILIDFLLWSGVFVLLSYVLLRLLCFNEWQSALGSFFLFSECYGLLLRPVALPIILPVFLLLVIGIVLAEQQKRWYGLGSALLAGSTALSFYFYGYLWQITGATIAASIVLHLIRREYRSALRYVVAGLVGLLFASPAIYAFANQFSNPIYLETIARIGLIHTHWPTMAQYYYGRWVLGSVLCWYLIRRQVVAEPATDIVVYGLGMGLALANWSNIFSGNELQLGEHVGRFSTWYAAIVALLFLRVFLTGGYWKSGARWFSKTLVLVLALAVFAMLISNLHRSFPWTRINRTDTANYEQMGGALSWLNTRSDKEQVVLADDQFAQYLPLYTHDFDLYAPSGQLQLMSDAEAADRYLLARALLKTLTTDTLVADIQGYRGAGEGGRFISVNTEAQWCRTYRLDIFFGDWCIAPVDFATFEGTEYWQGLLQQWRADKGVLPAKLAAYHVRYLVWPIARLDEIDVHRLHLTTVYQDSFYRIYALTR